MKTFFLNHINNFIEELNNIEYEWIKDGKELIFKKKNVEGFDVIIGFEENHIYIYTNRGYHEHFEMMEKSEEVLNYVFETVRGLLNKKMRIIEFLSNGKAYMWKLQSLNNEKWKTVATNSLILWNYFGRKSENIYRNNFL
jgi:hypothetical protein